VNEEMFEMSERIKGLRREIEEVFEKLPNTPYYRENPKIGQLWEGLDELELAVCAGVGYVEEDE
jgi:hypothetical protein